MSEDDQIQSGFQPEIQANSQIQQDKLGQNPQQIQEPTQQIIQQNMQKPEEPQPQIQNKHSSWLTKIVSGILLLLGFALIGLGVYEFFQLSSDWYYSAHYSTRDIIIYSGIYILGPLGILFILIGIFSYRTQDVDIYYHPTRLTKFLSGVYRFIGIALIRAGLWNFSLIGTENLSFLKILYVGGTITLCGILYILLGRLLYCTKNTMHFGFSFLCALAVNIMFLRILRAFTDDSQILESLGNNIVIFTLIYFSILTIRWIIKCRKFYKKGIINPKYLNSTPSKKKVGVIVTIVLISIVIINLIYGKIQWSKIPEVDESIFTREEHQNKLPDKEDALIQLKTLNNGNIYDIFDPLNFYYLYEWTPSDSDNNKDISWEQHIDECIIINSGGNEYCGTWAWNKKTLKRVLNNYYYMGDNYNAQDFIDADGYLSIDGKKVTIFEYISKNEQEIKSDLQKLDGILSLDYYLNFPTSIDNPYYLLPQNLQGYTRANMVLLQYYTLKEDRDMVIFVIKLEYKMVDILNHYGGTTSHVISFVIQNITDSTIDKLVRLFPNDFRVQLSERYSNLDYNKEWMLKERTMGEYNNIWKNRAKDGVYTYIGSNIPSLTQFMFHFPFFSKKDSNRFMEYAYYNLMYNEQFDFESVQLMLPKNSLYNYNGAYPYKALRPGVESYNNRLGNTIYHKNALITNLKSGKYDVWFSKLDWDSYSDYELKNYLITGN